MRLEAVLDLVKTLRQRIMPPVQEVLAKPDGPSPDDRRRTGGRRRSDERRWHWRVPLPAGPVNPPRRPHPGHHHGEGLDRQGWRDRWSIAMRAFVRGMLIAVSSAVAYGHRPENVVLKNQVTHHQF